MRSIFGGALGFCISRYLYGSPQPKVNPIIAKNPELALALEDKDSLQYADFVKKQKMRAEIDFHRPGKIKD